jgi:hypothetical protein
MSNNQTPPPYANIPELKNGVLDRREIKGGHSVAFLLTCQIIVLQINDK